MQELHIPHLEKTPFPPSPSEAPSSLEVLWVGRGGDFYLELVQVTGDLGLGLDSAPL